VQKERSTEKKQPSPLRSGREVACRFRPASTIFRKLGPNAAKERAGVVLYLGQPTDIVIKKGDVA
jgi:hypothetical protein